MSTWCSSSFGRHLARSFIGCRTICINKLFLFVFFIYFIFSKNIKTKPRTNVNSSILVFPSNSFNDKIESFPIRWILNEKPVRWALTCYEIQYIKSFHRQSIIGHCHLDSSTGSNYFLILLNNKQASNNIKIEFFSYTSWDSAKWGFAEVKVSDSSRYNWLL